MVSSIDQEAITKIDCMPRRRYPTASCDDFRVQRQYNITISNSMYGFRVHEATFANLGYAYHKFQGGK